jgi:cell division septal protein FtsQ
MVKWIISAHELTIQRFNDLTEAQRLSPRQKGTQMIKRNPGAAAFLIAVLMAGTLLGPKAASAASIEIPRISIERTKQMLTSTDVIVIDVRTAKTWWRSANKIENSVREDPGSLENWADKYPKSKTLIFYCS